MVFDDEHVLIAILGGMEEAKQHIHRGQGGQYRYTNMEFLCKAAESQDATEDYNGVLVESYLGFPTWLEIT